jgi:predicted nucleic-acid-binding Zn-ribbon protein
MINILLCDFCKRRFYYREQECPACGSTSFQIPSIAFIGFLLEIGAIDANEYCKIYAMRNGKINIDDLIVDLNCIKSYCGNIICRIHETAGWQLQIGSEFLNWTYKAKMRISDLVKILDRAKSVYGDIDCRLINEKGIPSEHFFVVEEEYNDGWIANLRSWPY